MGFCSKREKEKNAKVKFRNRHKFMKHGSQHCRQDSNPTLLPIKLKRDNIKQFIRLSQWHLLREKESRDEIIELELLSQD